MEDVKVGLVIRAVRIRRGLRQADVASAAGLSQAVVSLIERGHLEHLALGSLRRVGSTVGVSISVAPRWRGVELAKLLDERHALMIREVVARLTALGWEVRPEVTFSVGRESGSVDILAWLPVSRAVLVVEVKSLVPDIQDMLATLDRKRRLAIVLARQLGWHPLLVGTVLVLPEEGQARNAVGRFAPILDAALPARTVEVRKWLRAPGRDLRGIWFLANRTAGDTRGGPRSQIRVGTARKGARATDPRSANGASRPRGPRIQAGRDPDLQAHSPE